MSSHHINVELGAQIVEAQVTLSLAKLNDILRIIIDQSNTHETNIDELRQRLAKNERHSKSLEEQLEKLRPDGDKMDQLVSGLDKLKVTVERHRQDTTTSLDNTRNKLSQRLDGLEAELKAEEEARKTDIKFKSDQIKDLKSQTEGLTARLDRLKIPDIGPLASSVAKLEKMATESEASVKDLLEFMRLWSVDPAKAHAANTAHNANEARVSYVRSLPPMQTLFDHLAGMVNDLRVAATDRLDALQQKLTEKVDATRLADLLKDYDAKLKAMREDAAHVERRVCTVERIAGRVAPLEERLEGLRHSKADHSAMDLKADTSSLHHLASNVSAMQDDINDLYDKLPKLAQAGASNKGPPMAAQSSSSTPRRPSENKLVSSNVAIDELRKQVAALETTTKQLEANKADRSELMKLHEYLEVLEEKLRAELALAQGGGPGDGHTPNRNTTTFSRPNSGRKSKASNDNDAGGGGDGGGHNHQSVGQGLPPVRPQSGNTRPTSSGHRSTSPRQHYTLGSHTQTGVFFPIVTSITPSSQHLEDDGSTNLKSPTPPRVGNSWHLGRSVCTVRDSGGSIAPAASINTSSDREAGLHMKDPVA